MGPSGIFTIEPIVQDCLQQDAKASLGKLSQTAVSFYVTAGCNSHTVRARMKIRQRQIYVDEWVAVTSLQANWL